MSEKARVEGEGMLFMGLDEGAGRIRRMFPMRYSCNRWYARWVPAGRTIMSSMRGRMHRTGTLFGDLDAGVHTYTQPVGGHDALLEFVAAMYGLQGIILSQKTSSQ